MRMRVTGRVIIRLGLAGLAALAGCGDDASRPVTPRPAATVRPLTATGSVYEANPTYAPDGSAILFEADATGNLEIWRLPLGGGVAEQLTHNTAFDSSPCWLPDGSGFMFESDRSGTKSIWLQDLSSPATEPTRITDDGGQDGSPAVSPDGALVVFESNRGGPSGIDLWVSPLGGGTAVRLTTSVDGSYDRTADWSPDGNTIVFESNRVAGRSALYTVPAKGGTPVRLTPLDGYRGHPAWSPDGARIAYESTVSGDMEIWCINADGTGARQLTDAGGYWPRWSPDGHHLVYGHWGPVAPNLWEASLE